MRTLVTGASGFIAGRLRIEGERLDIDLTDGADVCDIETEKRIREFDPEVVFHLAARHYIPWCESHPQETARTNVTGTARILESTGPSLRSFVFASSAAVYGFAPTAIKEWHPQDGRGTYAWTKQIGESLLEMVSAARPTVRCVAARLFNVVGAGDGHAHVLPSIAAELCGGRAATLGNLWPRRDYIHVADAAEALAFLAERAPIGFSAYNVATGHGTSVRELVQRVSAELGIVPHIEDRGGRSDDGDLIGDPTKLRKLGWLPRRTLGDAVREVVAEVREVA